MLKRIIILNGAIASGKTSIGKLLVKKFNALGDKSAFYDLDDEVYKLNPRFDWDSPAEKVHDWFVARQQLAGKINHDLQTKDVIVAVGPFFLKDEITGLTNYLVYPVRIYLYTLLPTLKERLERNAKRSKSVPEEKLFSQEAFIENLQEWYGVKVNGSGSKQKIALSILQLLNQGEGEVKV